MEHLFIKGTDNLFVLFHGTGGNESNLLFLTGELDSHASVISFLGNVGTGKNRRFIKVNFFKKPCYCRAFLFIICKLVK